MNASDDAVDALLQLSFAIGKANGCGILELLRSKLKIKRALNAVVASFASHILSREFRNDGRFSRSLATFLRRICRQIVDEASLSAQSSDCSRFLADFFAFQTLASLSVVAGTFESAAWKQQVFARLLSMETFAPLFRRKFPKCLELAGADFTCSPNASPDFQAKMRFVASCLFFERMFDFDDAIGADLLEFFLKFYFKNACHDADDDASKKTLCLLLERLQFRNLPLNEATSEEIAPFAAYFARRTQRGDAAENTVERLLRRHPHVPARLVQKALNFCRGIEADCLALLAENPPIDALEERLADVHISPQQNFHLANKSQQNTVPIGALPKLGPDERAKTLRLAYDSDEFDDSFDVQPPVDVSPDAVRKIDAIQTSLLDAALKNPAIFERSAAIRKSAERVALLKRVSMSHEQLEGWWIMFQRNVSFIFVCFLALIYFLCILAAKRQNAFTAAV